ncbi:GNAT family N-acetyltransferase [Paractinoplanes abujensis]|uniref:Ribosomal protein S18 acetylase RimI-like enzyme n=1 Tax=Paractinoplanes abujensis TaxID=882441 RepID=A0A7W7D3I6_9ACTN|nr:GNAT family N-acetyltransferase [Actinoplanes abujensis]MBB4698313.1 ribosomal protein S18 acetylase RimI-like enzyme [Actinoplanes abujensis]GID19202.1 GNAT family N-acetyltransferase [Actinoplanes abujensis]
MPIEIRPLAASDIPAVVEFSLRAWAPVFASFEAVLGRRIFERIYPDWHRIQAAAVEQTCRELTETTWVAVENGQPLGFVAVVHHRDGAGEPNSAEIEMIAVDPDAQRRGIARTLIAFALAHMRTAGCVLAVVATGGDPGHAPARAAYEEAGFTGLPLVRYYQEL